MADAVFHRVHELVVSPGADAGFLVGRQVGAEQIAERRVDHDAAGKGRAAGRGMAGRAIAGCAR